MSCQVIDLGGARAIVCTRGPRAKPKPCHFCSAPHEYLCDGKHCDLPLCAEHVAQRTAAGKDYCRSCADEVWQASFAFAEASR